MLLDQFTEQQLIATLLVFIWTGFVRSGLGFGGAALGLPLFLFIDPRPIIWLPMIGWHLLFFSSLTISQKGSDIDWSYLRQALKWIIPAALVGVLGLISLPNQWLLIFVYSITLFYALMWVSGRAIQSHHRWVDHGLLLTGGYVAGTSLTGAPLIVAVFMRHVTANKLRNTLFVLWFMLVSLKMGAFVVFRIDLQFIPALWLLLPAAVGHIAGLKTHQKILQNDALFKKIIGGVLALISTLGLWHIITG
jgi:uncharacterized protein